MRIHGSSMLPLLRPGDLVLVKDWTPQDATPTRGEIVAARPMSFGGRAIVKRIAGLPHEHLNHQTQTWHLSSDQYLLLGDALDDSLDSRTLGPVTRAELIGRVWFRLWPPTML